MGALVSLATERTMRAAGLEDEARRAAVGVAARDWLATQARVVEYWRDLIAETGVADGGDAALVAALDAHAAFLHAAGRD